MKRNNKLLVALSLIAILILGAWLLQRWMSPGSAGPGKAVDQEVEGVNLTYMSFNKDNEKKLEVKCAESQKGAGDRLQMKKIIATIIKADKLDKDIRVTADSGTTQNEFNDFHLQGNVVITSPSFTLSGNSFELKYLAILSTREAAAFTLSGLAGKATRGLEYQINKKYMKMSSPQGVLRRAGKPYRFQAQLLRLSEKRRLLLLDREAQVDGDGTLVRGDRISMQFDQDFVNLEWAAAFGNCYFRRQAAAGDSTRQNWEIAAKRIKMSNDAQGRLQKIEILGDGEIALAGSDNSGRMQSGNIKVLLDSETQVLRTIRSHARGTLISKGKDNLSVSGDSLLAEYAADGTLTKVQAQKNCTFRTDDFQGHADAIEHDVPEAKIYISGKDSSISSRKNVFTSSQFLILTKTRYLRSRQGVKATLVPGKKSVLLGPRPVFVTAAAMETSNKGDAMRFTGKVNLFQDEIELHAGELLFDDPGNRISCSGDADLKFSSDGETLLLRGKTIAFDSGAKKIVVEGEARLQQGANALAARRIELAFGRNDKLETIHAADSVTFSKGEITGKAQLLYWQYARKTVLFRNAAEITRKGAGTTRGQELRFRLDSNEISVSGAGDRSETTIRRERP